MPGSASSLLAGDIPGDVFLPKNSGLGAVRLTSFTGNTHCRCCWHSALPWGLAWGQESMHGRGFPVAFPALSFGLFIHQEAGGATGSFAALRSVLCVNP